MKKFIMAVIVLLMPSLALATTVSFKDDKGNFTIGEKRTVAYVDGKKYICEFGINMPEDIDDEGLVFEAAAYGCGNRIIFILKHYTNTDFYQVRLYNARTKKYLYDNRVLAGQFSVISKT